MLKRFALRRETTVPVSLFLVLTGGAFLAFFDPTILNPANVGWLSEGDLRQHYLGWLALRQADTLGNPLGTAPLLAYPFGTPISATDSNPLVSLLLWPIADLLPEHFQFIGPWYLLSLGLNLFFAAKLMTLLRFDRITGLFFGAVLAFQPILFWRYGHDTLTAHWLILAAIHVSFAVQSPVRALLAHATLLLLAMAIHPYLFIALNIIVGFDLLARALRTGGLRFGLVERTLLIFAAADIGGIWLGRKLGVFSLETATANEIGVHSADPLGFLNPFDAGRLPQLPAAPGQYEGFAYLGLGGLLLLLGVLVLCIRGSADRLPWKRAMPMIGAALAAYVLAIFPTVSLFGNELIALDVHEDGPVRAFYEKLRSNGRFIWITVYALVFLLIAALPKEKGWRLRAFGAVILVLQLWDLKPLADRIHRDTAWRAPATGVLDMPEWQARIAGAEYIYLSRGLGLDFSLGAGAAAFPQGTALTWFYTAQSLRLPRQIAAEEQIRLRVLNGNHDQTALHLLDPATELEFVHRNGQDIVTTADFGAFHALVTDAFGTDRATAATHGLTDLLDSCTEDCTALLVVHDRAARHLSVQARAWMAARGGVLTDLYDGAGYAAVVRDGQLVDDLLTPDGDATLNAIAAGRAISLLSSVQDASEPSSIMLDGVDYARATRGINLLLVHDDGRLVSAVFDTEAQSDTRDEVDTQEHLLALAELEQRRTRGALGNEWPASVDLSTIEGPVSARPFVNLGRVLTRESSLLDVMTQCRQGCAMAISVKDEGSASMPLAVRVLARKMGLELADLAFRDGYSAILESGIVLVQGLSQDEVVDVSEVVADRQIRVRSAGYEAGSTSSIAIDGEELSLGHRGVNIVVLLEGGNTIAYHFDTHGGV